MPTARMCRDTVTLYNYVGEVNYEAVYEVTILQNVCVGCEESISAPGNITKTATLSIFDQTVAAKSTSGKCKRFVTREEWEKAESKSDIWTVDGAQSGKDAFVVGECTEPVPPTNRKIRISASEYCGRGTIMTRHWSVKGA